MRIIAKKGSILDKIEVDHVERIDQILVKKLGISRNKALNLIKNSKLLVDDEIVLKPSLKPNLGSIITIYFSDENNSEKPQKKSINISIIYEDSEILVINKPANLVVHPAPSVKEYTLSEYLLDSGYKLSSINKNRPGVVHRLDRGTSGALVMAKTNEAHESLSTQFKLRSADRIYIALLNLALKDSVIVDRPIGRNPKNRLKKAVVEDGRASKTAFTNLYLGEDINLIAAKLHTGRTHQIRVHLNSLGRYILGDNLYGFKRNFDKINSLMLHSFMLSFDHPISGKRLNFIAELEGEFRSVIDKNSNKEQIYEKISADSIISSFEHLHSWVCYN